MITVEGELEAVADHLFATVDKRFQHWTAWRFINVDPQIKLFSTLLYDDRMIGPIGFPGRRVVANLFARRICELLGK